MSDTQANDSLVPPPFEEHPDEISSDIVETPVDEEPMTREQIVKALTEGLVNFLDKEFGEDGGDILNQIRPLFAPLIEMAIQTGIDQAEHTMVGLISGDTYPHWKSLIEFATPEQRIALMEQTRQEAVIDTLKLIERRKEQWAAFQTGIRVALSILVTLLAA